MSEVIRQKKPRHSDAFDKLNIPWYAVFVKALRPYMAARCPGALKAWTGDPG